MMPIRKSVVFAGNPSVGERAKGEAESHIRPQQARTATEEKN